MKRPVGLLGTAPYIPYKQPQGNYDYLKISPNGRNSNNKHKGVLNQHNPTSQMGSKYKQ